MDPGIKTETFLSVLEAHKGIIYKLANAYCNDVVDRQDLVQEIVVQLWRAFDTYDSQYKYSTFIYRIALNVAISFQRKEHRRKKLARPLPGIFFEIAEPVPREADDKLGILQRFIFELKEFDKALMLLYLDERPYREIAGIMGISESNVATRVGRIKDQLKQKFSNINA